MGPEGGWNRLGYNLLKGLGFCMGRPGAWLGLGCNVGRAEAWCKEGWAWAGLKYGQGRDVELESLRSRSLSV